MDLWILMYTHLCKHMGAFVQVHGRICASTWAFVQPLLNQQVESQGGRLIFNGPRVRMGIHFAQQGTIGIRWVPCQHPHLC